MKKINFSTWPNYSRYEANLVKKIIQSNKVNYWSGKTCKIFEKKFSKFHRLKYAVSVMNGSIALEVGLRSIGIKKDDEVIVTSKSFVISASALLNLGAKPVFSDINYESGNIDPDHIKKIITKKTKAIVVVHLSGWPCEMDKILKLCKKFRVKVVEDCSQAHGAKFNNKYVGSFGDLSIWSFCNDKIMTTGGEGGMIATNNRQYFKKANSYKDHGKNFQKIQNNKKKIGFQYVHDDLGTNYRMTAMQAALGIYQLEKLDEWVLKRLSSYEYLISKLKGTKGIILPKIPKNIKHATYRMYIYLDFKKIKKHKNVRKIIKMINDQGVPCSTGACSEIYNELVFKKYFKKPFKRLANAKLSDQTSIAFFVNPFTKKKEINYMADVIKKVFSKIT